MRPNTKPPFLAPLRGLVSIILVVVWLTILFSIFFPVSLLKVLIPIPAVQYFVTSILLGLTWLWIGFVNIMGRWTTGIEIDVQGLESINKRGHYFIFANHSAWTDIIMLFHLYHGRMPFPRWFMKRELIWLPMIGYVCWAVDMPFMHRLKPSAAKKRPELKGKDLENTRRACEKFRRRPVVVVNYLEGTRFTWDKHQRLKSSYRNLLPPKLGGAGFTLNAMGELLDGIIDMTVVFSPGCSGSGMDYAMGRIRKVIIRARVLPVPMDIVNCDLRENEAARIRFRDWVNEIWEHKDRQIDEIKAQLVEEFGMEYDEPNRMQRAES